MPGELTLPERLRVVAALNPDGFTVRLSRDDALYLVKTLEERARVAEADKWVHNLLADRRAWMDRREREFDSLAMSCMWFAVAIITMSWGLGGWF